MAKGIGLIGNFKGKVGNMVGYKLSDSNTGNTQGIRVYQPIVRNPKTSAQAEQRAKLAPINATYRALKMVIDRGNEGLPYGNKSRLAWLKQAFKAEHMPWIPKGGTVDYPVGCQLTKGSLASLDSNFNDGVIQIAAAGITDESIFATIGAVSTALKAAYPFLKDGDQISFVAINSVSGLVTGLTFSFLVDTTSTVPTTDFEGADNKIVFTGFSSYVGAAVIISREGVNGEHLRSNATLTILGEYLADDPYDADSKAAVIASYQNAAGANSDWAEESIQ